MGKGILDWQAPRGQGAQTLSMAKALLGVLGEITKIGQGRPK